MPTWRQSSHDWYPNRFNSRHVFCQKLIQYLFWNFDSHHCIIPRFNFLPKKIIFFGTFKKVKKKFINCLHFLSHKSKGFNSKFWLETQMLIQNVFHYLLFALIYFNFFFKENQQNSITKSIGNSPILDQNANPIPILKQSASLCSISEQWAYVMPILDQSASDADSIPTYQL